MERHDIRRTALVTTGGLIFRMALYYFLTNEVVGLEVNPILSTPVSSYRSLQECGFRWSLGDADPNLHAWSDDACRVPPLLLYPLHYLGCTVSPFRMLMVLLVAEAIVTASIANVAASLRESQEVTEALAPAAAAAVYILNPFSIISFVALSTNPIKLAILAAHTSMSISGSKDRLRGLCLSMATLALSLHFIPIAPLSLALPAARMFFSPWSDIEEKETPSRRKWLDALKPAGSTLLYLSGTALMVVASVLASWGLAGYSWVWFDACVTALLQVRNLWPNLGPYWYLMTLIFPRYRNFFLFFIQSNIFIYALPIFFKLQDAPRSNCIVALAVLILLQPYPAVGDFAFLLALLCANWSTVKRQGSFPLCAVGTVITETLFSVMSALWLQRNTGNANFPFNIQLVHFGLWTYLLVGWTSSSLEDAKSKKLV